MTRPTRHLQNEDPPKTYPSKIFMFVNVIKFILFLDFKKHISLVPGPNGKISVTANFLEGFPVVTKEIMEYLENSLDNYHDHENPSIDYQDRALILRNHKLHLDNIPLIDKDIEILFCRSKEDMASITVDLVRKYVDPTMEFDEKSDYSFSDEITVGD